jgi:hypothetical protein
MNIGDIFERKNVNNGSIPTQVRYCGNEFNADLGGVVCAFEATKPFENGSIGDVVHIAKDDVPALYTPENQSVRQRGWHA